MSRLPDTRQYFDLTASTFSANYRVGGSFEERRRVFGRCVDDALSCLGDGSLCLDIGCGDGLLSRAVAARGFPTIGFDQSKAMLTLARRHASETEITDHVEYIEATVPLPPELLDRFVGRAGLVLCSSVLEYIDDYEATLRQFGLMLKPGGRMIVSVPNRHSVWRRIERIGRRLLPRRDSYLTHQRHQFSADAFKARLATMDLPVVHDEYFALPLHSITAPMLGTARTKRWSTLYLAVAEKRPSPT